LAQLNHLVRNFATIFLRRKWRRKRAGFTGDLVPVCRVRGVPSDERSMGATALGSQCNDAHNTHLVGRFFWWMLARNHLAKKPKTRIEQNVDRITSGISTHMHHTPLCLSAGCEGYRWLLARGGLKSCIRRFFFSADKYNVLVAQIPFFHGFY